MTDKYILILLIFLAALVFTFFGPLKVWFARRKLYKNALKEAAAGKVEGYENLGVCYEFGYGIGKDSVLSKQNYHKAARMGSQIGKAKITDFRKIPTKKVSDPIDIEKMAREIIKKQEK